jgi:ketosteroid isomerase-like protein
MFTRLVEPRVRETFDRLTRREFDSVVASLAPDVHHRFAGEHALGGERHDREAVRAWFGRLARLFPELSFEVQRVVASGPPWDLRVAVEWTAHARPLRADPHVNRGAHVLRIVRGRVKELYAYEDSQLVARACEQMARNGIAEAAAAPITS